MKPRARRLLGIAIILVPFAAFGLFFGVGVAFALPGRRWGLLAILLSAACLVVLLSGALLAMAVLSSQRSTRLLFIASLACTIIAVGYSVSPFALNMTALLATHIRSALLFSPGIALACVGLILSKWVPRWIGVTGLAGTVLTLWGGSVEIAGALLLLLFLFALGIAFLLDAKPAGAATPNNRIQTDCGSGTL